MHQFACPSIVSASYLYFPKGFNFLLVLTFHRMTLYQYNPDVRSFMTYQEKKIHLAVLKFGTETVFRILVKIEFRFANVLSWQASSFSDDPQTLNFNS